MIDKKMVLWEAVEVGGVGNKRIWLRVGVLKNGKAVYWHDGYQVKNPGVSFLEDPTLEEMMEIECLRMG